VTSKLIAALIQLLIGLGKALPTLADNQSKRIEIKRPAKEERSKLRALRIKRKQLKAKRKLRKREQKGDT